MTRKDYTCLVHSFFPLNTIHNWLNLQLWKLQIQRANCITNNMDHIFLYIYDSLLWQYPKTLFPKESLIGTESGLASPGVLGFLLVRTCFVLLQNPLHTGWMSLMLEPDVFHILQIFRFWNVFIDFLPLWASLFQKSKIQNAPKFEASLQKVLKFLDWDTEPIDMEWKIEMWIIKSNGLNI